MTRQRTLVWKSRIGFKVTINHPVNKVDFRQQGTKDCICWSHSFLDADDCWDTTYLETIASLIDQYPEAKLFATNYLEIYSKAVALPPKQILK
jgi:hypothetical protein